MPEQVVHHVSMIEPATLQLAATGLLPPDVIARLAGMTVDELMARHGAEIRTAIAQHRRTVLRDLLQLAFELQKADGLATALSLPDEDWRDGFPKARERRFMRGMVVQALLKSAFAGRHWRNVEACDALLRYARDADFLAGLDRLGVHDQDRQSLPDPFRQQLTDHLKAIMQDPQSRPGLKLQAGRALLRNLPLEGPVAFCRP